MDDARLLLPALRPAERLAARAPLALLPLPPPPTPGPSWRPFERVRLHRSPHAHACVSPHACVCVQVVEVLSSVGFTPQLQSTPVGSLSGGWKMKLALGEMAQRVGRALPGGRLASWAGAWACWAAARGGCLPGVRPPCLGASAPRHPSLPSAPPPNSTLPTLMHTTTHSTTHGCKPPHLP